MQNRMTQTRKTSLRAVPTPALDYALHIALEDLQPTVWRRVVVPSTITLPVLHGVMRVAMGWESGEAHEFVFGRIHYGEPHPIDPMPDDLRDETDVTLKEALGTKRSFEYLYDYSSAWWHNVTVERFGESESKLAFPLCIGGENACPPPGIRGVGEYEEFLEAIADPKHARHDEFRALYPERFQPTAFDLADVSRQLSEITNL
jgi:hypothetical protein